MNKTMMENNYIIVNYNGDEKVSMTYKSAEALKQYRPSGCPFPDYSLLDLLKDFVSMYSWILDRGKRIALSDFIEACKQKDIKAEIYGNAIIELLV